MDDLVQVIGELARGAQRLARVAVQQYSTEVDAILKAQSRDSRRIERCLDGMLDFCFDDEMLALYKKLCRYYFAIDAEASASYVQAYREMWEGESKSKKAKRQKRRGKPANRISESDVEWDGKEEKKMICVTRPTLQETACLPKPRRRWVQAREAKHRTAICRS